MISPAEFIPVAEEKGIISQLDEFVANDVNRFMKKRIEENRYYVPVSINLSRMDFYNPNMLEGLLVMMDSSKVDNRYFRYEITESSFTDVNQLNDWILPQMRERGNKILIDDFGTGYSSLANIVKQDFNLLKIDMSFVRNIGKSAKNEAVIQAIIDMAHHMNTTVVAEGVETLAQLEFLRENNCDCIQGYYFSKPLSEEEFIQRLDQAKEEL